MRNISRALRKEQEHSSKDWFSTLLLDWYHSHKRDLPWRETKDPYKVWISEIILQQTRVNQGLPYYLKFTDAFQNISEFAQADLDDILKLWQGLGYYSRARNMHTCARVIVQDYAAEFPDNYHELQKLKGIGKYTAAAIASICFDESVPTVDGNVFRVLSRLFGISDDITKPRSFKVFFDKASKLISDQEPGDFNQAIMEFGAMVCTPKSPDCPSCILVNQCFAKQQDLINQLPVKSKNVKVRQRYFNYHVFTFDNKILIRKRVKGDIWTGLHEFELEEGEKSLKSSNFEEAELRFSSEKLVHQLTHQKLHIKFHVYVSRSSEDWEKLKNKKAMSEVAIDELDNYAVPKPIELFLNNEFCQ